MDEKTEKAFVKYKQMDAEDLLKIPEAEKELTDGSGGDTDHGEEYEDEQ